MMYPVVWFVVEVVIICLGFWIGVGIGAIWLIRRSRRERKAQV